MASSGSGTNSVKHIEHLSSDTVATLAVSPEHLSTQQEQQRLTPLPQHSRPFRVPHASQLSNLPYPLNLPPVYAPLTSGTTPTRTQCPPTLRESASLPSSQLPTKANDVMGGKLRVRSALSASSSKGKGKGTLDAFMDSRQVSAIDDPESSSSDSDISRRKVLALPPSDDYPLSDSSAIPSSSPASSSSLQTPKESSPLHSMYAYASSPTPKRPSQSVSNFPFVLPPGPYMLHKPHWSLSALIGQALNASRSGSLALNDIYTYISTVYPHYNRAEQSWMSSVRHNLSLQDAFEKVPDESNSKGRAGKNKPRGKGSCWRIKPGHEACFLGGSFVKKGARGAGPGLNQPQKRRSEDDGEYKGKRPKAEASTSRAQASTLNSISTRSQRRPRPPSSTRTIYSDAPRSRQSSPTLTASQSTVSSEVSLPEPSEAPPSSRSPSHRNSDVVGPLSSPDLPLALVSGRAPGRTLSLDSSLEPGFELSRITGLQSSPQLSTRDTRNDSVNRDLFTRVLASTSSAHASSSLSWPSRSPNLAQQPPPPLTSPAPSSTPPRTTTPTPRQDRIRMNLSPTRTPMSHKGVYMSPSRSLAHYESNLGPEWLANRPAGPRGHQTPPRRHVREQDDEMTSTPKRLLFQTRPPQASPFRTPARPTSQQRRRGYDPYDPNTLLADELAGIRDANDPQESPGGFFGKEGRRLLYESPGMPSRSHWRYRDEL